MRKIYKNLLHSSPWMRVIRYTLLLVAGILLGWLFFHSPKVKKEANTTTNTEHQHQIWTCSMHPQIRSDKPGKCPICGMDLIPLKADAMKMDSSMVHLSEDAMQLANVATTVVTKQNPLKEIRLYGKVEADERLLQNQVAQISGRIDKLMINFTGETVNKGQLLAQIYSPELITAQQEFLEAVKTKTAQPEIYEAARQKLHQWLLTEKQITQIEKSGQIKTSFEVYANTAGVITNRRVNTGDYVQQGAVLFEVADLSSVWVKFDAYESDLPFLKKGDLIRFSSQSIPEKTYQGRIGFIDPVMDAANRVARVRVEIPNGNGKLKPEMFVTGLVEARLDEVKDKLVIPRSAVLWTGKRSVVYVKQGEGMFTMREIEIGPTLGNSFVVLSGLYEGDEIVTDGTFNVDAAAQLDGKSSMMEH